jgi:hypothetical protein
MKTRGLARFFCCAKASEFNTKYELIEVGAPVDLDPVVEGKGPPLTSGEVFVVRIYCKYSPILSELCVLLPSVFTNSSRRTEGQVSGETGRF